MVMKGGKLRAERTKRGWSQKQVARRLGVSQPYVGMLEHGKRPVTPALARKLTSLCRFSPALLPPAATPAKPASAQQLACDLASLGYPGYAYLRSRAARKNPGEVLLTALAQNNLEPRVVEALPWLLLEYGDMDFTWLVTQAKTLDLQNRLGFVASLARRVSAKGPDDARTRALSELEATLERSRLVREDDFMRPARNDVERRWLMQNRPEEARHWNLVTDLRPEHLGYHG
jgi:transcriptional regulator with XRE-family HTH domain